MKREWSIGVLLMPSMTALSFIKEGVVLLGVLSISNMEFAH